MAKVTPQGDGDVPREPKFSSVPDSASETEFTEESSEERFEPYVEWTGGVGYREITDEQWKEADVTDQGTVVWTRESPRVNLSELSDAARQRLAGEPNFNFVTEQAREED